MESNIVGFIKPLIIIIVMTIIIFKINIKWAHKETIGKIISKDVNKIEYISSRVNFIYEYNLLIRIDKTQEIIKITTNENTYNKLKNRDEIILDKASFIFNNKEQFYIYNLIDRNEQVI